ncbi:hypothetical protein CEQ90_01875 [Lewinellaceae bacterium SD302]|nr:hypothetical protein CEQ90_01875 [Lewinellaceae bacterium SD302]
MTNRERAQAKSNESTVAWDPKSVPSDNLDTIRISPRPVIIGVMCGVLMALYLAVINGVADFPGAGAKIFKYVLMGGFLTWALVKMERKYLAKDFVQLALMGSAIISGVSAAIVAVGNLIFYGINPDWGFAKFAEADGTGLTAISYSAIQLFEVFAIGMIISFILIQFLKGRSGKEKI